MALRNVSNMSNYSTESTDSLRPTRAFHDEVAVNLDEVLKYTIKVILLEYLNEPRFRQTQPRDVGNVVADQIQSQTNPIKEQKRMKRRSWLFGDEQGKRAEASEAKQLQKIIPELGSYLRLVAMGKISISEALFRRSLLKLYNDDFLNPQASKQLASMSRVEELIILFTKAAQNEIAKMGGQLNGKEELFNQVSKFTDALTQLVSDHEAPNSPLAKRIHEYKKSFELKVRRTGHMSPFPSYTSLPQKHISKPSFRLSDICHSSYLIELFGLSEIELQQKIVKYANETTISGFCRTLGSIRASLVEKPRSDPSLIFVDPKSYEVWREKELSDLVTLINKFGYSNPVLSSEVGDDYIPRNTRGVYNRLLQLIWAKELSYDLEEPSCSKNAFFLIHKCASYWRITLPSTKATLLYSAAIEGPMAGNCLNTEVFNQVFTIINSKILDGEPSLKDGSLWTSTDHEEWLANLLYSYEQCFNLLRQQLAGIHEKPRPKFSSTLDVYYNKILPNIELADSTMIGSDTRRKHIKKLRRVLFKASELYYVNLVRDLPRERDIEFQDVKNMADSIVLEVQNLQKRYSKPLLGEINLALECGKVLVEAFGVDCSAMLAQVRQASSSQSDHIPYYDATETYKSLRELRDVHLQIQPSKPFPFKLEKYFLTYLSMLCDDTCLGIRNVIQTAIAKESWDTVDENLNYSTSVIDVFKMINESFEVFGKLGWEDQYQISKIYTFLLKSAADGLSFYSTAVASVIVDDIKATEEVDEDFEEYGDVQKTIPQSAAARMKNSWVYTEMKNVLKSHEFTVPKPFEFQRKTCICLNNLSQMMLLLNSLESRINPEEVSSVVTTHEQFNIKRKMKTEKQNSTLRHLYTIRVVRAEDLSSSAQHSNILTAVSIVDTKLQREVAKTREVMKSGRPVWNEEFELDLPVGDSRLISFILWTHKSRFNSESNKLYGRALLSLDPKNFRDDGYPQEINLNLDSRGKIIIQISVETEKLDALFSMGRAFRSLTRARDRSLELMVSKFQVFVHFALSKTTLKTVCGSTGTTKAGNNVVYDSIVPLFDYLNANLDILASHLPREVLLKLMLEAWEEILNRADELLLPFVTEISRAPKVSSKTKTIWENAVDAAKQGINSPVTSDRPLTKIEIDTIFEWLRALCVDFFHNNGEGPAIEDLKNRHYQSLLLIPTYYDKPVNELKDELKSLDREYSKLISESKELEVHDPKKSMVVGKRERSIARRKTIIANALRKRRLRLDQEIKEAEKNPLENIEATRNILLRILVAKGESDFVADCLKCHERMTKALLTEKIVRAARSSHH
ncbi:LADA_0H08394g1_1 [Lachancea dasiensis]|uniref:LADA_0H08394g1_1 n=1 Tax=Lachancea dasiensis TaxID=1072105 RepID=A0A1G4K2F0_9SACH|nr:LADA_0H08394g1_1 [Lachancea dasiensis]